MEMGAIDASRQLGELTLTQLRTCLFCLYRVLDHKGRNLEPQDLPRAKAILIRAARGSDSEVREAFEGYIGYFGTYSETTILVLFRVDRDAPCSSLEANVDRAFPMICADMLPPAS
jgi:hypothetical protein